MARAAHDLFDTPTVSEAPTDSFEEDFEPDFFQMDEDIKRKMNEKLLAQLREVEERRRKTKRRHHSKSRCKKRR